MKPIKIILDTDIGDDIDDALALALIMRSPELELLGVTTCFNNAKAKAKIARNLLNLGGRQDIPVYAGIDAPLLSRADHSKPPRQYEDSVKDLEVYDDAVGYLYKTLKDAKEKITLVTIGPLTNIGVLFATYPEVKKNVEKIVMMGGCFYSNQREWNILCDAESADIVFRSGVPIVGVGLDVTLQCAVPQEKIDKIHASSDPVCQYLSKLIKLWNGKRMFIHDPLAVMMVYDPSFCTVRAEKVEVETKGSCCNGMTFTHSLHPRAWDIEPEETNVLACMEVDSKRVISHFMERII